MLSTECLQRRPLWHVQGPDPAHKYWEHGDWLNWISIANKQARESGFLLHQTLCVRTPGFSGSHAANVPMQDYARLHGFDFIMTAVRVRLCLCLFSCPASHVNHSRPGKGLYDALSRTSIAAICFETKSLPTSRHTSQVGSALQAKGEYRVQH